PNSDADRDYSALSPGARALFPTSPYELPPIRTPFRLTLALSHGRDSPVRAAIIIQANDPGRSQLSAAEFFTLVLLAAHSYCSHPDLELYPVSVKSQVIPRFLFRPLASPFADTNSTETHQERMLSVHITNARIITTNYNRRYI